MRPLMLTARESAPPLPRPTAEPAPALADFPAAALVTRYALHPLPAPPAEHSLRPTAINDDGVVIANLVRPARFEGATWTATGVVLRTSPDCRLPLLDDRISAETSWPFQALSADGAIVGTRGTPADERRAWASHVGEFGEDWWPGAVSIAQAVNRAGVVVGKTFLPAAPFLIHRAFLFGESSRPRFLTPPEGGMTDAVAINDDGAVLLNATALVSATRRQRAWLWHDQTFNALETPTDCSSIGTLLTADHAVAGYVRTDGGLSCAALWRDGRLVDLGTSLAADFRPHAARTADLLVGSAVNPSGRRSACRWTPERGLQFLSDLTATRTLGLPAPHLTEAVDINRQGQILGLTSLGPTTSGVWLDPVS